MGNLFSRNFNPLTDLVDLEGKVVIVTGGNAGIGLATVQHLARAGAKVYLAARNESRASAAIVQLQKEGLGPGSGEVLWLELDLNDPRDARQAAKEFLMREKRLDILVNNAGLISAPYTIGPDGVTMLATVNFISPFVFTQTLIPLLRETAKGADSDVRVVNLTSIAHKLVPSDVKFDEIADLNIRYRGNLLPGFTRYAHSKFMLVLWSKSLQRRFDTDPSASVTVIAVHPGGVDTFTHTWVFPRFFKWLVGLVIAQPEVGAYNSVFAAAALRIRENRKEYQGVYLESQPTGRIASPNKAALREELGERLWTITETFLTGIGI